MQWCERYCKLSHQVALAAHHSLPEKEGWSIEFNEVAVVLAASRLPDRGAPF